MSYEPDLSKLKAKAARYCSLRERSKHEVEEKLKGWNARASEIHRVIKFLSDENYINDERFAKAYCMDKFKVNGWGRQKIKAAIGIHRIETHLMEKALSQIDDEGYRKKLFMLAEKKWSTLSDDLPIRKGKTIRFLIGRGFEYDLIIEAISEITKKS